MNKLFSWWFYQSFGWVRLHIVFAFDNSDVHNALFVVLSLDCQTNDRPMYMGVKDQGTAKRLMQDARVCREAVFDLSLVTYNTKKRMITLAVL